jgi:hypothetical protein
MDKGTARTTMSWSSRPVRDDWAELWAWGSPEAVRGGAVPEQFRAGGAAAAAPEGSGGTFCLCGLYTSIDVISGTLLSPPLHQVLGSQAFSIEDIVHTRKRSFLGGWGVK